MAKWDFAWMLTLERKWKTPGWIPLNALKLITFVKGQLNVSYKSTTAANVDLTESLLDNWLKNNQITVDKTYYLRSLFVYIFTNFSFQIYFSTEENLHKNKILWHFVKIRLEWISQSNGSIGRPLGFVIDRLNTSASLCRISPCLTRSDPIKGKDTPPSSTLLASSAIVESQNECRITKKSWRNSVFFVKPTESFR